MSSDAGRGVGERPRWRRLGIALLVLLLLAVGIDRALRRAAERAAVETAREAAPAPAPAPQAVRPPPPPPARPPATPDPGLLALARELMAEGGRRASCGPYALYTDVAAPQLVELCGRVAGSLDEVYEDRFGLRPLGDPAEAILLFRRGESFRELNRRRGRLPAGYAGYADGARGVVVLFAEGRSPDELAQTLAHELAHLLHRRTFGPDLPPWLSEGLADAIGDPATAAGLAPLRGLDGVAGQAERLRAAYRGGRARPLDRLAALARGDFDSGAVSYDYEQSALLVRFCLLSPRLRPGFLAFLRRLAASGDSEPQRLVEELGLGWDELEREFRAWLGA